MDSSYVIQVDENSGHATDVNFSTSQKILL